MIDFKTPIGNFKIPTNYSDVTINDLNFIRENIKDPIKVFTLLTKLKPEKLQVLDLNIVLPYLDFMKVSILDSVESSNTIIIDDKFIVLPEDLGGLEWGQKIVSSSEFQKGNPVKALAVYLQPIIESKAFDLERLDNIINKLNTLSVEDVYSLVKHIVNGLKELTKRDLKMLKPEISIEQQRAGIKMFNQLGDFNTINMIANDDVTKYAEVLKLDYNTIFNKLLQLKIKAKFDKNLNKILNEKR